MLLIMDLDFSKSSFVLTHCSDFKEQQIYTHLLLNKSFQTGKTFLKKDFQPIIIEESSLLIN